MYGGMNGTPVPDALTSGAIRTGGWLSSRGARYTVPLGTMRYTTPESSVTNVGASLTISEATSVAVPVRGRTSPGASATSVTSTATGTATASVSSTT